MDLPFEPVSVSELRTRVDGALEKIWDCRGKKGAAQPGDDVPELHREHLLDFVANGVPFRIILNQELLDTSVGPRLVIVISVVRPKGAENLIGWAFAFGVFMRQLLGEGMDSYRFVGHIETPAHMTFYLEPTI